MNWGTLPQEAPALVPFLDHLETQALSESAHVSPSSGDPIWPAWIASQLKEAGITVKWGWESIPDNPSAGADYLVESSVGNVALEAGLFFDPVEAIAKGATALELVEQGVLLAWDGSPPSNVTFRFSFHGPHARLVEVDVDLIPSDTVTLLEDRLYDGRRLIEAMLSVLKTPATIRFENPSMN